MKTGSDTLMKGALARKAGLYDVAGSTYHDFFLFLGEMHLPKHFTSLLHHNRSAVRVR